MFRFSLVPVDAIHPHTDIIVPDAADVLEIMQQLGYKAGNVESEGKLAFSLTHYDAGLWCISNRPLPLKHRLNPLPIRQPATSSFRLVR